MTCWAPHVLSRQVGDELVLLDLEQGEYFGLDPIGAELVTAFADEAALSALCERLSARYEASAEQLRADAERLRAELGERRLLVAAAAAAHVR